MHHSSPLANNLTRQVIIQIKSLGFKVLAIWLRQSIQQYTWGNLSTKQGTHGNWRLEVIITFIFLMVTRSLVVGDTHLDLAWLAQI